MEKDELIQKYIHGRLNETEKGKFDALLKNDPEFVKAVAEFKNVQAAISSHEKDELKSQLQQLEAIQENTTITVKPSRNYKRLAIAIGLILFFGLIGNYFIQLGNSNETLYATYFEPYPNALAPVKRSNDVSSTLTDALYAYEIEDYTLAIEKFEEVSDINEIQKTEISFYKAMSFLNLGNEEEAISILRSIKHDTTRFSPQIYWYGALIHIKLNENEKALKALKYMDNQNMSFKSKEREILKEKIGK
ncbi:hypothetical protein [uncultured Kordia sp.]|uniref:hypothetical protein n=1 Tax=uncultured Kordia sp. TaxID=507699 RepID=UPI00261DA4B6|nr:hypothetical protein [uncultured Kordia sp.]